MEGERDMPAGLMGKVAFVDGQIHVQWENGRTLALSPELDDFQVVRVPQKDWGMSR